CVTGLSVCHLGEHFQCSNDTISKYFKRILITFSSQPIYTTYVRLPSPQAPTPPTILKTRKFYLYFADVISAINGTHIACHPTASDCHPARDRK
ncbi:hypothetical protein BDR03DRAFT_836450, partial [Suillus americanus]